MGLSARGIDTAREERGKMERRAPHVGGERRRRKSFGLRQGRKEAKGKGRGAKRTNRRSERKLRTLLFSPCSKHSTSPFQNMRRREEKDIFYFVVPLCSPFPPFGFICVGGWVRDGEIFSTDQLMRFVAGAVEGRRRGGVGRVRGFSFSLLLIDDD